MTDSDTYHRQLEADSPFYQANVALLRDLQEKGEQIEYWIEPSRLTITNYE